MYRSPGCIKTSGPRKRGEKKNRTGGGGQLKWEFELTLQTSSTSGVWVHTVVYLTLSRERIVTPSKGVFG